MCRFNSWTLRVPENVAAERFDGAKDRTALLVSTATSAAATTVAAAGSAARPASRTVGDGSLPVVRWRAGSRRIKVRRRRREVSARSYEQGKRQ